MAGYKFFAVMTDKGKELLTQAIANETPLDFTEMAIGDSNGTSYDPTPDMTALKHEVYRGTISSITVDENDKNHMVFEFIVPASSGGYYIREMGLFAADGTTIAIGKLPEQYKASLGEGAGAAIRVRLYLGINSEAQIYINVPESNNYATQTYVTEKIAQHVGEGDPHEQYVLEAYAQENYATKGELSSGLGGKANTNHNHDGVYVKVTDTIDLPIGFIYLQLKSQETPDVVFGTEGKWQDISSEYAGEFFRAVGGDAASFGSKQEEGLPNIIGTLNNYVGNNVGESGALYVRVEGSSYFIPVSGQTVYTSKQLSFDASKSNSIYGTSAHVTPVNSAVRVWKKVA